MVLGAIARARGSTPQLSGPEQQPAASRGRARVGATLDGEIGVVR